MWSSIKKLYNMGLVPYMRPVDKKHIKNHPDFLIFGFKYERKGKKVIYVCIEGSEGNIYRRQIDVCIYLDEEEEMHPTIYKAVTLTYRRRDLYTRHLTWIEKQLCGLV